MGIRVNLDILPAAIPSATWASVYDETLSFLNRCPDGILCLRRETVGRVERLTLSRALEWAVEDPQARYWKADGDAKTKTSGESFVLYRDLARYRATLSGEADRSVAEAEGLDILAVHGSEAVRRVFNDKTQGTGYHIPILAAAMLVEAACPRHALVHGDIDLDQAEEARALIRSVLGKEVALPIVTDGPRLLARLVAIHPEQAAIDSFVSWFRGSDEGRIAALTTGAGTDRLARWLGRFLRESHGTPGRSGMTRLLAAWFNTGQPADPLIEACCRAPEGPGYDPVALAEAVAGCWVTVPLADRAFVTEAFAHEPTTARCVEAQFGEAYLDMMGAAGRRCRVHVSEDALAAAFAGYFPDRIEDVRAALGSRTRAETVRIRKLETLMKELSDPASGAPRLPRHLRGELTLMDSLQALTKQEWKTLERFSEEVRKGRKTIAAHRARTAGTDALSLREVVARQSLDHGVPLTEDAWARLDQPDNAAELEVAAILLSIRGEDKALWDLRHAVLENPVLCRFLVRSSGEEEAAPDRTAAARHPRRRYRRGRRDAR